METTKFTIESLMNAVVNMGSDPFLIEDEEQAAQVAQSIESASTMREIKGGELETARRQLDCPRARRVYSFVDGSEFIVCLNEDIESTYTMNDLADYINESEEWPLDVEDIIEDNGWHSDTHISHGVCHNSSEMVVLDDNGVAVVVDNHTPSKMTWDEYLGSGQDSYLDPENVADQFVAYENDAYEVRVFKGINADADHYFSGLDEDVAVVDSKDGNESYLLYDCSMADVVDYING